MSMYQLHLWDALEPTSPNSHHPTFQKLALPDADIMLYPTFLDAQESDRLFADLLAQTHWRQDMLTVYGKSIALPRLTAWYGDRAYTYSGITMPPQPWTPPLLVIKTKVETVAGTEFNSVLLNLYRHGRDSVTWHSDDEAELGHNPVIASVSLGAIRRFGLRHKQRQALKTAIDLMPGSLLLMQGATQHHWQHQIPKTAKPVNPRINLTFRVIL